MTTEDGRVEDVVEWTVLKSIQQANAESMKAMESYLLVATAPDGTGSAEHTREFLRRSIERHERIVEQLELAAAEIDAEPRRQPTRRGGTTGR